jgi:hypothetical protein
MFLDIDGGACTYRGVPVQFVKSTINITDTNNLVIVDIHINEGATHTGTLKGRLVYTDDTDALEIDAETTVNKDELLSIINVLNRGELNAIRCDSGLRVKAKGVVTVNSKNPLTTNDLHVALSFDKGSILRIPLTKTSTDLHLKHFSALCNNMKLQMVATPQVPSSPSFRTMSRQIPRLSQHSMRTRRISPTSCASRIPPTPIPVK